MISEKRDIPLPPALFRGIFGGIRKMLIWVSALMLPPIQQTSRAFPRSFAAAAAAAAVTLTFFNQSGVAAAALSAQGGGGSRWRAADGGRKYCGAWATSPFYDYTSRQF